MQVKFGSLFALKRALNSWNAIGHILGFWALLIVIFGYFYRSFEMTSCQLPGSTHPGCDDVSAKVKSTETPGLKLETRKPEI